MADPASGRPHWSTLSILFALAVGLAEPHPLPNKGPFPMFLLEREAMHGLFPLNQRTERCPAGVAGAVLSIGALCGGAFTAGLGLSAAAAGGAVCRARRVVIGILRSGDNITCGGRWKT